MIGEPSTINAWLYKQPGPIHLRRSYRPDRRSDLDAARGIIVGVLGGANILLWSYIFLRAYFG